MTRAPAGQRTPCAVDDCDSPVMGDALCQTHRARKRRGVPLDQARFAPLAERWGRFIAAGPNNCWAWTGAINAGGYGTIADNRKCRPAHRVSYEIHVGPIPEGLQIDHLCANRRCVNPAHLEAVTCQVNVSRAKARITHCPHGHEYTPENTRNKKIGKSFGRTCKTCAREYAMAKRREKAALR